MIFAVSLRTGASATLAPLSPFSSHSASAYSCLWQLALLQPSRTQSPYGSIRLRHHPAHSCPWQLLLFAVYKPLFSQSSRMRSLLAVFASCSFLARVLRQHSLFFRPFLAVFRHTVACVSLRFSQTFHLHFTHLCFRSLLAYGCVWQHSPLAVFSPTGSSAAFTLFPPFWQSSCTQLLVSAFAFAAFPPALHTSLFRSLLAYSCFWQPEHSCSFLAHRCFGSIRSSPALLAVFLHTVACVNLCLSKSSHLCFIFPPAGLPGANPAIYE